jgi:hypothetical protein
MPQHEPPIAEPDTGRGPGVAAGDAQKPFGYLTDLFEYHPFTTVVVDRQGRITDFNAAKRRCGDRLPERGQVMYRDYAARHARNMHGELMTCMAEGTAHTYHDMRYDERYLTITIAPFPGGAIIVSQDVTDAKRAEGEMMALIAELHRALTEIDALRELLPICASCKRIRDDGGYWNSVEEYFTRRGSINFSHTLCPECVRKLYPGLCDRISDPRGAT